MKEINILIESPTGDISMQLEPILEPVILEIAFPALGGEGAIVTRDSIIDALGYVPADRLAIPQGDWNAGYVTDPAYIRNRTHFIDELVLLSSESFNISAETSNTSRVSFPTGTMLDTLDPVTQYEVIIGARRFLVTSDLAGDVSFGDYPTEANSWVFLPAANQLLVHNSVIEDMSRGVYLHISEKRYVPLDPRFIPQSVREQMPQHGGTVYNQQKRLWAIANIIDLSLSSTFLHELNGDVDFSIVNVPGGVTREFILFIKNTHSDSANITFDANILWKDGIAPVFDVINTTVALYFTTIDGGANWLVEFSTYTGN